MVTNISPQRPDLPATFESLIDDTLTKTLEFVGDKSYSSFGALNKRCKEVYLSRGMTKETFLYGYAPLPLIRDRYNSNLSDETRESLSKAVVFYNRSDVLALVLQRQNIRVLYHVCKLATEDGRIDLLEHVWNNMNNQNDKQHVFQSVEYYASLDGKLNLLRWLDEKGYVSINLKIFVIPNAGKNGHLHIFEWLHEEKGVELDTEMYLSAIEGEHFHVLQWLVERDCPWGYITFKNAARKGNLDILQWLHENHCPWPDENNFIYSIYENEVSPAVIQWCRLNGYGSRIIVNE